MPPVLVVIGDVMADVVVRRRGPWVEGSDTPAAITVRPGGSGSSLAVAAAAAGADVRLVGSVGDDSTGESVAAALRTSGVRTHLSRCGRRTGTVVALVNEHGTRTMLSDRGANRDLRGPAAPAAVAGADHLHVSGYVLLDEATRPVGLAALEQAAAGGLTTSVDASPGVDGRLPAADWCCLNGDEADALAAGGSWEALLDRYAVVAVTRGGDGATVLERGRPPLHRPAPAAVVVDTTGAGDAFAGTWIARRLAGDGGEAALDAALLAAARVVAVDGAGWG